jgi:hypothetical protein
MPAPNKETQQSPAQYNIPENKNTKTQIHDNAPLWSIHALDYRPPQRPIRNNTGLPVIKTSHQVFSNFRLNYIKEG